MRYVTLWKNFSTFVENDKYNEEHLSWRKILSENIKGKVELLNINWQDLV